MRVLITGGTGTLGHALVLKLLDQGHVPIIFSRDEYKQSVMHREFPDVEVLLGDNTKFKNQTGWEPEIPFEKTMKDLLQYWRERV